MKKCGVEGVFKKTLMSGESKEQVEGFLNSVFLSLEKRVEVRKSRDKCLPLVEEKLRQKKVENGRQLRQEKTQIQAKILSEYKTPLPDL